MIRGVPPVMTFNMSGITFSTCDLRNLGHSSARSMNAFSKESSSWASTLLPRIWEERGEGERRERGERGERGEERWERRNKEGEEREGE